VDEKIGLVTSYKRWWLCVMIWSGMGFCRNGTDHVVSCGEGFSDNFSKLSTHNFILLFYTHAMWKRKIVYHFIVWLHIDNLSTAHFYWFLSTRVRIGQVNLRQCFKKGSVIEPARVLGHWFIGRTTGSLVEPHDKTGKNRITRFNKPVSITNLYKY
jgi:hypothetical protein